MQLKSLAAAGSLFYFLPNFVLAAEKSSVVEQLIVSPVFNLFVVVIIAIIIGVKLKNGRK